MILNPLKNSYIQILQRHNSWGKSDAELEKEAEAIFELIDFIDIKSVAELKRIFKSKPQTRILVNTNEVLSPILLDYDIELPIAELFIDKENFVVFTTQSIYNGRTADIKKIAYKDIVRVDESSIQDVFRNRTEKIHLFDIMLITLKGNSVPITFEYGIPFRALIYFLTIIVNQHD